MKGISLKTIFIILVIILVLWAVWNNLFSNDKTNIKEAQEIEERTKETIVSNNIRIGVIELDNMNPIISNNKNVQDISRLIFDPLFTLTEDYKLKDSLAKEWSKLDDVTYLIKLKEDVKWQDGNKFDASDVIFTIDMLKKKENNSTYYYNVKDIKSVEEIDEYTLKITIDEEIPYFEYNLIFPIVSSKYFSEENFLSESKNVKPVGTGKFYISDVNNNSILLKKSVNKFTDNNIKLDTITLNLYDSLSSAINAFKAGEIDIFTTSNVDIEEYLKNTNYNKIEYINRNYSYIVLNCQNRVLVNQEVRQSINSAINREEIVKKVYNNKYKISNFPLDFGSYAYDSNNTIISYDKNVAKRLLVDNGWKYSSRKWRKTVNYKYLKIELDLVVNKTEKNSVKVANKIKEQLESIGIRINVVEATQKQYNSYLKSKNYDMILSSASYSYSPSLNKYFKDGNIANYQNDEITSLLNEIKNITDENELKQKYTRITEIYNDEVPYISLYFDTNIMIYSSNLKGDIAPNSYNLFYGIEGWYREYLEKK